MGNETIKILLIGLDNSGKTTILNRLINPNYCNVNITPTIGFQKNQFSRYGLNFEVYDMSGQSKYRDLWQATGSSGIDGIIFVIDSSDKMRINVARSQLDIINDNKSLGNNVPILFYSNKFDIKGSTSIQQVQQIMDLKILTKKYKIFQSCGISGNGIQDGIQWLAKTIKSLKF